ncbi:glycosyltransferase family 4 protein [Bacillus sp. BRMEA1]|uniref:glycosyltransferase family 4 protein n=1 Tax=Neobacillus endophyticus TaxID=2738405 RepID=UPI001567BDE3|nr:glycosyltransferase family 4 protein [Neobacillus endophyticus]NRD76719.1 glycosyltransferase family 4 protein [Neobacillus endophyticus]
MKVVIPVGDLHVGGGCKVLVDIANTLKARGHETEIVMPQTGTVKYDVHTKLTLIPELSKEHIPYGDIILTNFYTTVAPAVEAWPKQTVRLSLGFEPYWVPDKAEAIHSYQHDMPIISISHWLDEQIFQHVNKRSKVINLGIDHTVFHPGSETKEFDSILPKVILYIGRDSVQYEIKGFKDFAEAMKIVKKEYSGPFIVHMISPDGVLYLDEEIPYKIFPAQDEQEMAEHYRSADVFVSSSWFEAFSLPPLEAMACGTPTVTTNSGGVLDYCEDLESAVITLPKNPKSLATGILTVLKNETLAQKLSKGGLQSSQRFTRERFLNEIIETLEKINEERMKGENG